MKLLSRFTDNKVLTITMFVLVAFVVLFSIFQIVLSSIEFFQIAFGNEKLIYDYHFGSKSMIEKGGWYYKTKGHYLFFNLLVIFIFLLFIACTIVLILKKQLLFLLLIGGISIYCLSSLFLFLI